MSSSIVAEVNSQFKLIATIGAVLARRFFGDNALNRLMTEIRAGRLQVDISPEINGDNFPLSIDRQTWRDSKGYKIVKIANLGASLAVWPNEFFDGVSNQTLAQASIFDLLLMIWGRAQSIQMLEKGREEFSIIAPALYLTQGSKKLYIALSFKNRQYKIELTDQLRRPNTFCLLKKTS